MSTEPNVPKKVRVLLAMSTVLAGLLAGENMYRYFIEVPAWRNIGFEKWGEYTRHADLAAGMIIFPLEALIAALLLVWSAILIRKNKTQFPGMTLPIYLATALAVIGLALTTFAAPYLFRLRAAGDDPKILEYTFNQFHFWGAWRALMQIVSFLCCVWGMGRFLRAEAGTV